MRHQLYLVRHAIAAERGPEWPDDTARPLTPEGIRRFRRTVTGLARAGVVLDEIFTSPFVRAVQTARLLSTGLEGRVAVSALPALASGHTPEDVLEQARGLATAERIALVGHEPDLGVLAAHLLGAARAPAFKKGAVCRIDVERLAAGTRGTLVWFAPPRLLRGLAD
jgi:phosphohistidine phosphatase